MPILALFLLGPLRIMPRPHIQSEHLPLISFLLPSPHWKGSATTHSLQGEDDPQGSLPVWGQSRSTKLQPPQGLGRGEEGAVF